MSKVCSLVDKSCAACRGATSPLSESEAVVFLSQLDSGWSINDKGHLFQKFEFKNFKMAMELANKIGILADQEGHHPDLSIGWGYCGVEIWTHKVNGLTESDFIMAAKIYELTS